METTKKNFANNSKTRKIIIIIISIVLLITFIIFSFLSTFYNYYVYDILRDISLSIDLVISFSVTIAIVRINNNINIYNFGSIDSSIKNDVIKAYRNCVNIKEEISHIVNLINSNSFWNNHPELSVNKINTYRNDVNSLLSPYLSAKKINNHVLMSINSQKEFVESLSNIDFILKSDLANTTNYLEIMKSVGDKDNLLHLLFNTLKIYDKLISPEE